MQHGDKKPPQIADVDEPTVIDPSLGLPQPLPAAGQDDHHSAASTEAVDAADHPSADLEDQKTVISRRSPAGASWPVGATPLELGMALEGERLGHFELEQFIGGGGMGAVFRARDTMLGRVVAVKILSRDQSADKETLRRFKNEAQSAARLDHENIARVYYVGEDSGWNYIVFEYIAGENVRDLVERIGPLPLGDAVNYVLQISEALAHAAERDVTHRDIKPSNVLVTSDGRAKLVDMGLARLQQVEAGESDLTASGVTLGTFDYISPEQARDPRSADVRSDLYSLGCTLYYMLTGRPPFPNGTVLQKLLSHSSERPPDPRSLRDDLPEDVTVIVSRLLSKRREDRYQNPRQLIGELLVMAEKVGLRSIDSGTVWLDARQTWMERIIPWAVPLLILVAAVFGYELWSSMTASTAELPPAYRPPSQRQTPVRDDSSGPARGEPVRLPAEAPPADEDAGSSAGNNSTTPEGGAGELEIMATDSLDDSDDGAPAVNGNGNGNGGGGNGGGGNGGGGNGGGGNGRGAAAAKEDPADTGTDNSNRTGQQPDEPDSAGDTSNHSTDSPPAPSDVAAEIVPRRIVIGDKSTVTAKDEILAASLAEVLTDERFSKQSPDLGVIELRYDGVRDEPPLTFPKGDWTIRGSIGYSPVIRFAPDPKDAASLPAAMIDLSGGKLTLQDVHLEFDVPQSSALQVDRWSLLELTLAEQFQAERCSVTVRSSGVGRTSYRQGLTAVIDVVRDRRSSNSAPRASTGEEMAAALPITLSDCVIRGEATMVRMRESVRLELNWTNGLLVTTERLLMAAGSDDASVEEYQGYIRLNLQNVTAIVDEGLCFLSDSREFPFQPPLVLKCQQCVVRCSTAPALVEHWGVGSKDEYASRLVLDKRGTSNFYQDVDVFWNVRANGNIVASWNWEQWKKALVPENGMPSFTGRVRWQRDLDELAARPVHRHVVNDYLIEAADGNPSHSWEAGFLFDSLPRFPSNENKQPPSRPAPAPSEKAPTSPTMFDDVPSPPVPPGV